jgi:hypothetical protein
MVQMKNKIRMLLMEAGVCNNKQRMRKAGYFRELLATNPDIDPYPTSPLHDMGVCYDPAIGGKYDA